jgi:hypothetical protein
VTITPQSSDASTGPRWAGIGSDATGTPAGWYPDPAGYPRSRWWDGAQWTMHYNRPFDAPVLSTAAPVGEISVRPTVAATISSFSNVWIWLVIVLPYATLPFLFGLEPLFRASILEDAGTPLPVEEQLAIFLTPSVIAFFIVGFASPWITIFCSYRDWQWLKDAQIAQPFHWAWSFLTLAGYPVYAIGRAIITRRRTGQGLWVIWATIAMFVLSIVVSIAASFVLVAGIVR